MESTAQQPHTANMLKSSGMPHITVRRKPVMTFSIGGFNMQQIIKLNPMYWYITGFRRTVMWGIPLDFNKMCIRDRCAACL